MTSSDWLNLKFTLKWLVRFYISSHLIGCLLQVKGRPLLRQFFFIQLGVLQEKLGEHKFVYWQKRNEVNSIILLCIAKPYVQSWEWFAFYFWQKHIWVHNDHGRISLKYYNRTCNNLKLYRTFFLTVFIWEERKSLMSIIIACMGKIAGSVLLKLFINGYERWHTIDAPKHERDSIFKPKQHNYNQWSQRIRKKSHVQSNLC